MRRLPKIFSAIYLAGGLAVWISFVRTNHDGLANVGLILYVFPVSLLGLAAGWLSGTTEFLLIPDRFGYYGDHAVFFFPSLFAVAALIAWVVTVVQRIIRRP
jgi:hypothetical protein